MAVRIKEEKRSDLSTQDAEVKKRIRPQSDNTGTAKVTANKRKETGNKKLSLPSSGNHAVLTRPRRSLKNAVTKIPSTVVPTRMKRKAEADEGFNTQKKVRCSEQVETSPNAKSEYQRIVQLANILAPNFESFECSICFSFIEVGAGVILQDCFHSFCRPCLASTVEHSETVMIQCPFVNDAYACESHLRELEIKSIVSPAVLERYHQRSIILAESSAENSFHCKTANCQGWCVYDQGVQSFPCNVCGRTNCLSCSAIHEGRTCEQYKDEANFRLSKDKQELKTKEYIEDMLKNGTAMLCPKCKAIVKKNGGCDGLICRMCRTTLCWATKGLRYGPKGCKCWEKGRKCHPSCMGCH